MKVGLVYSSHHITESLLYYKIGEDAYIRVPQIQFPRQEWIQSSESQAGSQSQTS